MSVDISADQQSEYDESINSVMAHLLATTKSGQSIRIIVTLNLDDVAEITPEVIAEAQAKLLDKLSDYPIERVKQYHSIPVLALTVGHDALKALFASPAVKHISPDGLTHTMDVPSGSNQGDTTKVQISVDE